LITDPIFLRRYFSSKAIDHALGRHYQAGVLAGRAGYSFHAYATNCLWLSGRKAGFSNFPKLPVWCELW